MSVSCLSSARSDTDGLTHKDLPLISNIMPKLLIVSLSKLVIDIENNWDRRYYLIHVRKIKYMFTVV